MWIGVFVHVCVCMDLEITTVVSWHLGYFNNIKISWLKSLTTFSLRTILNQFSIGGAQHIQLVSFHDTRSSFNKSCHSKLILLLMNQPTSILHKLCSTLEDAHFVWEDTTAVCLPNTINCLNILVISPLTFVHSEISYLLHVKIAHNIPNSHEELVDIETKNWHRSFFFSLKDKLAEAPLQCLGSKRPCRVGYL